jgi:trimeric autotransporter adhesin
MRIAFYKFCLSVITIFGFSLYAVAQPANDNCANAIVLTSSPTLTTTSGTLNSATQSITPAVSGSCVAWSSNFDVWYRFTATQTSHTVTISGFGSNYSNREFQVYNGGTTGTCPTVATGQIACGSGGTNSVTITTTVNNIYFIRVSDSWSSMTWGGDFTVSVSHRLVAATNNTCGTAFVLTQGASCTSTIANLQNANNAAPTSGCGHTTPYDTWFRFTATGTSAIIRLSNLGSSIVTAVPHMELLSSSGACTGFTSLVCQNANTNPAINYTGLTIGTTYYIRVYTTSNPTGGSFNNWGFEVCVTNPIVVGGRTNEVFKQTLLVSPNTPGIADRLSDPWEITYGPDDSLWVTEAKGYKVKKINPNDGGQRTILNLTDAAAGGTFTPATFRRQFSRSQSPWPQGGMMGLAIHPDFNNATTPKKFVYLAYVREYITPFSTSPVQTMNGTETVNGYLFKTWLVRFTYNGSSLVSPEVLCDTLVGSNDHNSGRMIIKQEGGVPYLFYAVGDMGSGQYDNASRTIKSQLINSYEGKILRFNLEADADAGALDKWIPNNNPFNATLGVQSAVWSTGMRNNQGFALNPALNILYGSSHGPFSDDEINIIEGNKNYGHPLVIGSSADGNYNNAKAGPSSGSLPLITTEAANVTAINTAGLPTGTTYQNPIFNYYPAPAGNNSTQWSIQYIYSNQPYPGTPNTGAQSTNQFWSSEGISGMDIYTQAAIPGWKNSLLNGALKGGRVLRNQLNAAGTAVVAVDGADTVTYFRGVNRFRDLAISPDGKNIFSVIDSSSTTSGPTTASPVISSCRGCLQRYTFLGYNDNAGASTISTNIPIAPGINDNLTNSTATAITNADNNNLWVPITDSVGNIIAEIDANGNNLGNITGTLYKKTGAMRRTYANWPYLNRSLTISVQNAPATNVNVRFYITAAELAAIIAEPGSGVGDINSLFVFKNNDANSIGMAQVPTRITPTRAAFGSNYVLTASISGFSSFYFAGTNLLLAADQLVLSGKYNNEAVALDWKTINEIDAAYFILERSFDNKDFVAINNTTATGNTSGSTTYNYSDKNLPLNTAPVAYYRVKLVGNDGKTKQSNTIAITLPYNNGIITVAPNPAIDQIKAVVTAYGDGKATWKITDNAGRVVGTNTINIKKGNNQVIINISNLAKGMYNIQFNGATVDCKTKFQKM